jgi:hypothetical protein
MDSPEFAAQRIADPTDRKRFLNTANAKRVGVQLGRGPSCRTGLVFCRRFE